MVSSEKHQMTSSAFNYRMVPQTGENRVVFKLTDRFNNTATADVFIKRENELASNNVIRPEYSSDYFEKTDMQLTLHCLKTVPTKIN